MIDIFGGTDTREEGIEEISTHELVLPDNRRFFLFFLLGFRLVRV